MRSSGTNRNIRRDLRKSDLPVDPLRPKTLQRFVRLMAKMDRSELKTIPGLEPKRIDLILSGSVLLDEIVKFFGCKKIFVTEFTLRDGVLAAQINDLKKQLK